MINKSIKIIVTLFIGLLLACDSTGICTNDVTPTLQLGFAGYDNLNNEVVINPPTGTLIFGFKDGKDVNGLPLYNGSDKDSTKFYPLYPSIITANEKKLIPLLFDENRDELTYIMLFEEDATNGTFIPDTISLSYTRIQSFVSPECGYKTVFDDVILEYYSKNKVDSVALLLDEIEYDIEQHIKIFIKE